ncbi:hypothetical protein MBANPS3_006845 [Mucor bainieri]
MTMNIKNKITNLQIGSLNCRSLAKLTDVPKSSSFSRYLTTKHLDILCVQESHAQDDIIQQRLDIQLKSHQSIWSTHCGIVALNPQVHLTHLYTSPDDRIILCRVLHNMTTDNPLPSQPSTSPRKSVATKPVGALVI